MNPILRTETLWALGLLVWSLFGLVCCHARAGEPLDFQRNSEIVISIKDQKLALLNQGRVSHIYPVSTSRYGLGDNPGSYMTPLGLLVIRKKIGNGCPLGTVFKRRVPTGEVLAPNARGRDPIVTRILWLDGRELQNSHAFTRCIYIHGTPQENLLGRPVSYGCIRMRSKDVALLADSLPLGTAVRITEGHLPKSNHSALELIASVF